MEEKKLTEWLCVDCNRTVWLDTNSLQTENDVLHVTCKCGKDFMLGMGFDDEGNGEEYTFPLFSGEDIAKGLQRLLPYTRIHFTIGDELIKHARFNRWEPFKKLFMKYHAKLTSHQPLVNYLAENMIF